MAFVLVTGKRNAEAVDRVDPYSHWKTMDCALKHHGYEVTMASVREDLHATQTHCKRLEHTMTYTLRL
jgi:hypothetical protein